MVNENKQGRSVNINVVVIMLVALAHTFIHYSIFTPDEANKGVISGFSINEVKANDKTTFSFSIAVIAFEWGVLILMVLFSFVRNRVNVHPQVKLSIDHKKMRELSKNGTEIDMLYELLKNNKSIRLTTISKLFEVDTRKVSEWTQILEAANLAYIHYPKIGEPELIAR